jgi:hypothetical protein
LFPEIEPNVSEKKDLMGRDLNSLGNLEEVWKVNETNGFYDHLKNLKR